MLAALLLALLQDLARPATQPDAEHPVLEDLAALSTRELALRYPPPNAQRGQRSEANTCGWNSIALELKRRLDLGDVLRSEEWRTLLVDRGYVHLRPRWPAGIPLTMRVERPWILLEGGIRMEPLPSIGEGSIRPLLAVLNSDERSPMCGEAIQDMLYRERHKVLGLLPRGAWHVDFRTEIEQSILDAGGHSIPGSRLWSGVLGFDIEIVGSVDEVVPPDRDERWTRLLRSSFRVVASKPDDERHRAWLELDLERASWPAELQAVVDVELLFCGCPSGTSRIDAPDFPEPPEPRIRRSTLLERLPWPVACGDEGPDGWSVRIRGVRGDALYDWDIERWWAGEIEIPLADLIRH